MSDLVIQPDEFTQSHEVMSKLRENIRVDHMNGHSPGDLQSRKLRMLDSLQRNANNVLNHRNDNITNVAANEQLKHDITQFRESIGHNLKQCVALRHERQLLEHRFKWTRSDFSTALATSTLVRQSLQNIIHNYQREIALEQNDVNEILTKLDDVQYFYTIFSQLQTKYDDSCRLTQYLKNDVVVLQSILSHIMSFTFDERGLPKTNVAELFNTIPTEDFNILIDIARQRASLQDTAAAQSSTTTTEPSQDQSTTQTATSSNTETTAEPAAAEPAAATAPATTSDDMTDPTDTPAAAAAPTTTTTDITSAPTPSSISTDPASTTTTTTASTAETLDYFTPLAFPLDAQLSEHVPYYKQQLRPIDTFLTKCVSLTGQFQPQIYLEHLRRQSDQVLLLQRSQSLLTSQLFHLQQERLLLHTYFESFLKETASLKIQLEASNSKIETDTLSLYSLQQQCLALQKEIAHLHQEHVLTVAAARVEDAHQMDLLATTTETLQQSERQTNALAIAHMTIAKLRTTNLQQQEELSVLQDQVTQSEEEKQQLLAIIAHLEQQLEKK